MHRRPPLSAIMILSALAMVNSQGVDGLRCRNTLECRSGSGAEPGPIDVFNQAFFVADILDQPSAWTNCAAFDSFHSRKGTNQRPSRLPVNHHPRSWPPRERGAKNSKPFPDSEYMHFLRSLMSVGVHSILRRCGSPFFVHLQQIRRHSRRPNATSRAEPRIRCPLSSLRTRRQYPGTWKARSN